MCMFVNERILSLTQCITPPFLAQKLYSEQLSMAEADDAAGRLVSFFKILADIAKQQKQTKEV